MKQVLMAAAMTAALASLAGCATTDADGNLTNTLVSNDNGVVIAMNAAMAYEGDLPSGTAVSGDALFTQMVGLKRYAKLTEAINSETMPLIGKKYVVSEDNVLYPAINPRFGIFYCQRDLKKGGAFDSLMGNTGHRACLRDSDDDEKFDQIWGADEATARNQYSSVFVNKNAGLDLSTPVGFNVMEDGSAPADLMGVFYTFRSTIFGGKQIVLRLAPVGDDGEPTYTGSEFKVISIKKTEFPLTVYHNSAEIIIHAVDEDAKTIDFEVTSAFPDEQPVLLPSERAPVVVYY